MKEPIDIHPKEDQFEYEILSRRTHKGFFGGLKYYVTLNIKSGNETVTTEMRCSIDNYYNMMEKGVITMITEDGITWNFKRV